MIQTKFTLIKKKSQEWLLSRPLTVSDTFGITEYVGEGFPWYRNLVVKKDLLGASFGWSKKGDLHFGHSNLEMPMANWGRRVQPSGRNMGPDFRRKLHAGEILESHQWTWRWLKLWVWMWLVTESMKRDKGKAFLWNANILRIGRQIQILEGSLEK